MHHRSARIGDPLLLPEAEAQIPLALVAMHLAVANVRANLPLMKAEESQAMENQLQTLVPA